MFLRNTLLVAISMALPLALNARDYPEPPGPEPNEGRVYEKAGLGSYIPYSEAGVLELGGFMSFVTANDFSQTSVSPTVGWFFADNFQISGILSYHSVSSDNESSEYWTALAEPSYHLPFNNRVFGFAGLGAGIAQSEESGTGTAIQPRLGANILVGRSGVLTPSIFTAYNSIDSASVDGTEVLEVDTISGFNVGYTVIW